MRFISPVFLAFFSAATVTSTTGVAPTGGSGSIMERDESSSTQRLLGIHHVSLRDGVTPQAFERFVVEDYNPVISHHIPGVHIMVMKGERNASGSGEYLVVWDVQSVDVRDWYYPTPDTVSAALTAINEVCGETCTNLNNRLFNVLAEQTSYTDYVEVARD